MNRVILLRTVHTREGGGGTEHIFDIDIKHQCLTQHIFTSILYILKEGVGGGNNIYHVLEYTLYILFKQKISFTDIHRFLPKCFQKYFFNKTNSML